MKIKKGDNIIVIAGKDKGKTGKVVVSFPKDNKILVEGVNVHKKHQKPTKSGTKGQVIDKAMPIDVSNVMINDGGKRARVGKKLVGDKFVRINKKTGKEI
ncbi:MAG: 50S ribosomal protein L24 [Candidatus Pacebacteria bacterium]|nr:50S ribosomal protein L24 [Candidatus Paceibacterota bacterium]